MAKKYQDGQYGRLAKKSQKNTQKKAKKKEESSLGRAVSQAASTVQKSSRKAISQGKSTPIRSGNQQKYQDGQYGQFIKNSRLGQSGAAQRNNAQNQQQTSSRRKQQNTKAASTYGELNERVNKRNQEQAKQRSKSAHRLANATKGTLQQTAGSHATTFYAARNPNEDKYIQSEKIREQRGEKNRSKFSEGQFGQLVKKERSGNVKEREKNLKKASELIDKGNKNIEKSKEGLSKGGKFAVDTYSAMLGMATDAATGPFSMGSMASRSFGAAYDTAKKEGADDTQAALYGASQAAIETGTEKMFSIAKPLRKLYGGGAGDDVAEKLLEKMTKKAATKTGKEVVYHSGKTTMAALSEGLEEMVSEGLEPAIANAIYANATGTPHSTSLKDILYAGAVGGAMGGILGGGGQAVEYNQGRKVQNVYGNDGLKTMAKKLRDVADEESGRGAVGEIVNRAVDAGEEVTSMQARRLYQAAAQQEEADFQRQNVMETVANNDITKKNYLNPVSRDEQGNMLVGEVTRRRYDEAAQKVENQVNESGIAKGLEMPEHQVQQIASAISAIQTGVAGTNEVNMFLAVNPKARTVYETVTGEKLPAENTAVKDTLYAKIAANRVESAKLESEGFADRVKGGMTQDVARMYEASGQSAFEQMLGDADVMNAAQTQNDIVSFEDYYRAGRNGIAYETVARMNNPVHQTSSAKVRQAAWEAGRADSVLAADTAKGVQMEIGKKISQSRSNGKSGRHGGRVVSELSQEAKRNLPASQQRMFRQLARAFNVDIHIVDEEGFNGKYQDGEVYLSMQADRDLPYVFGHEITHHMQEYAPQEYNDLKELVRQAWAEKGGVDDAVSNKIAQYAEKDVKLSYEDALDEIIADSTYEMIQDENFVQQLCSENRTLSRKILDAIKSVLSKLRQVLAEGDGFTPAQNAALLSNLDILKDAEKLWTDGLMKAGENRDAVGMSEQNGIRYEFEQSEDEKLYQYIEDALEGNLPKKSYYKLSESISDRLADDIKSIVGFSVKGYGNEISPGSIRHIEKRHGENGPQDHSMSDMHDLARIGFVVDNYDKIRAGKMSTEYRNKDGSFAKTVELQMNLGDEYYYVVEAVPDAALKTLHITTAYKNKNDTFSEVAVSEDPSRYVHDEPQSNVSVNNSISQNNQNNNGKFSLKDSVEQSGNLIALHNVFADKLLKTLKLGGFPMPSIAVTKADIGHTNFGEISLLFNKDTIDPARNENKVYGADAWTPTFPGVEYELDSQDAYRRANAVGNLTFFNPTKLAETNLQDVLNKGSDKSAEEQFFDRFKDDYGLKNMYLAETSEPVKMEKIEKEIYPKERAEKLQEYIDTLGIDGIRKIKEEHDINSEDFAKAKEICAKQRGKEVSELKPIFVNMDLSAALNYAENGNKEVVEDEDATKNLIDEKVNQKDYEKWLRELFDGIVKDKGLWNGEDPYTSSGDRKAFNKIHMPVTADNIVRAMLMQADDVRNSSNLFLGTRTVRAVAAEDFKSIEGIRKASGKLKNINTEEYDSVKDELDSRLNSIMREISDGTSKSDNEFMDMDSLGRGIEDACRKPTPENFKKVLGEYGWKISDKQAKDLNEVVSDIANMPVNMFEAKPQRVVGFDEIEAAVVPSDASKEVRDALNDAGIETIDYEAENEADRIAKVNEVADQKKVKFSLKNKNITLDTKIPYTVHQSYIAVPKNDSAELKKLQDKVRALKRGTYENKATGYKADIVRETVGKIINPSGKSKFNHWAKKYIDNLNAAAYLPELFRNAVYVDTKGNQKSKKANQQIRGYHHFVAPIYMDDKEYRVRIVAREKQNSDTLYIVETEVMKIKNGSSVGRRSSSRFVSVPSNISIPELVDGVKIYDYDMQRSDVYTHQDLKYSLPDESSIMDYAADHETEFVEVPPVRDYERRAMGAKQQTYNELRAQVDKLKQDKKLTKGRILNKKSVKEQINDMVVMLKSYGDPDGKKTDHKLVNAATENIAGIFRYMKEGDYAGAVNQAYNSAQDMIDNLHLVDDSMMREYKELRDVMRTTKISVSEEDAASIPDFKEWKKSQFGRLRIARDGMAVDSFYEVLCEKYPELFDYSVSHPADQLQAMADVRESMEPIDIMLDSEERSDLIKQTAQDMIDIAATGKPWTSWADRKKETYDEQVKRLKQRQKEALRDLHQKEKEHYNKKLQQERQKWKERQQKESEKHKEKLNTEKEKYKSKQQKQKYSRERREIKAKIENTHKWLSDRLLKPTDDKHIPEDFRKQIAHILVSLDMQTERSKDLEFKYGVSKATLKLRALRSQYEEIAKEDGTGIFAYDDTLDADMEELANLVDGKSVDQLTNEELEGLHQILKSIKFQIGNYNKWMSGYRNSSISEVANKSINACRAKQKYIKNRGKKREDGKFYEGTGLVGLGQSIDYAMLTPGDAFERFGEGMNEAYGALREGFDKHIQNIQTIRNFFDDVFTPYFKKTKLRKRAKPGSKIEEWRNTSTLKTFEVAGGTIKLNTSQIMSLYCLSKREQAMGHILGSGIVASRVDPVAKIAKKLGKGAAKAIGGKSLVQGSAVTVSFDDIEMIKKSLSNDQVEVCEKIMQFMNETCSAWGNEVSMKLYDYNKFTETNYFPIKSSDAYIDTVTDGTRQMQSVTSYGFTKGTVVNANNAIVIDDIFSVAADHMNKMSLYNAFAAPMHDFNKFYNYRVADEDGKVTVSVKSALKDAHGERAEKYINTFLKDVNNQASESLDGLTKIASSSLAAYKKSVIAANTRVALQQPTAVARAFIMIDPKYFLGKDSQLPKDEKFFKNMKDMQEHCPIALWKSWGFSQVDMARGIDDIMMNNEWTRMDRYTMEIYGALDNITWGQIWGAVRRETMDKHPDVQVNSDEFYEICSQRASQIFDKTQVVDSVFHRSQIMRSSDTLSKMLSSFMAEPTRTFNMMRTELIEGMDMIRSGEAGGQAKIARAISVFLFNAALCSAAAAVADALRRRDPDWDDDDDGSDWTLLEYWEKNAWANFKDNANPLNMIPVLKDLVSYTDGWDAQNMAMQGWAQLIDSFKRVCEGEDDKAFSDLMDALGMVTGVPIKNIKREGKMWFEILGIDVSAATKDGDKESGNSLIKKAKDFLSKRKSGGKSKGGDLEEFNYDDRVAQAKKDSKGLSGEEKQDAIWSAVTKNYTNYIKAGDTEALKAMRRAYEASGGDMDHFNETMLKKTKELYKKNIGEGGDAQKIAKYREYLQSEFGYTDGKISQEIVAKSNTAKAFQKNLCDGNEEDAVKALSSLIDAGISYEDFVTLYYNREKSLKASDYITGEFAAPVNGRISSGFGYRSSPGGIGSTNHKGLDIAVPLNTDVAAADGGKVKSASWQGGYGYMVTIDHGNGRTTQYAHLNNYYVKRGDVVKKGQIIALSGSTGNSTGPHLHFEVRESGTPVNPMNYLK